ncbi:hypothetical protein [Flavobacterium sp. SORGH_AS_0622]|uniref:hypothetical protein n=1 Tax=Flavobacterium sp. SORGH_AS_0622 TaxID=3041772 RepID=UPI002782D33C|nr:hypothetical protein [Flavobacterium sp. SORGH_AS_0622]MDQ1165132.1 hypothetical protein [Flavobacterium sp. SORGH_AS_0622]
MNRLIDATLEIMPKLGIEIRPAYKKDGELQLRAWDKLEGANALFTIHSDIAGIINRDSPDEMYYIDPLILTGHALKPILANFNNTVQNIKARSIIVHELTHWLQRGTITELHTAEGYISFNGNNYLEYISQKREIEAHAVQSYYFIREHNKNNLDKIVNNSQTNDDLCKSLINEFMTLTRKPIVF